MTISFEQVRAASMSMEAIQIGYMPPADKITADNVMNLVMYGQTKDFDFVVSPINSPNYSRVLFPGEGSQSPALVAWRAGQEAFKPEDLVLRTAGNRTSQSKNRSCLSFCLLLPRR